MPDLREVLCPLCVRPGGLKIHLEFLSKPLGTFSLAGAQMKLSVREVPVLSCGQPGCNLILVGEIQDGHAVFPDPHVEAKR